MAINPLGMGESTWPADGIALTLEVLAQANDAVTRQVRTRLAEGMLGAITADNFLRTDLWFSCRLMQRERSQTP